MHDNIPATLIADSAAAALMKSGKVDAVVVGADRVAVNGIFHSLVPLPLNSADSGIGDHMQHIDVLQNPGDTANKIGTYSLALCAKHHDIPFYVAAPLTSVDLSLSSGREIIIEERSPKELLNSRGGIGEQVAASGISVWNPAFDVTPADLITGIITEQVTLSLSLSFYVWRYFLTDELVVLSLKFFRGPLRTLNFYHESWLI